MTKGLPTKNTKKFSVRKILANIKDWLLKFFGFLVVLLQSLTPELWRALLLNKTNYREAVSALTS